MRLITVVMGSNSMESRARGSGALLNFAFRFFETHKLFGPGEMIATGQVWKGDVPSVNLGVADEVWVTIPRGQYKQLKPVTEIEPTLTAPISKGQTLGTVKFMLDTDEIASRPLVALDAVNEGSLFDRLKDEVKLLFQ